MIKLAGSIFITLLSASCGASKESELVSEVKSPAISKEFLVDMALMPAPEGKCANGGVMQNYYYDLNGNGQPDAGESSGLASAIDCYSGYIAKSNPCENLESKCDIPKPSKVPILRDCRDATNDQKLMAAQILDLNGQEDVPLDIACTKLVELTKSVKDTNAYLNVEKTKTWEPNFVDYSILPILANLNFLGVSGVGKNNREIRNFTALKNLQFRVQELFLSSIDFKEIRFLEFLPEKGAAKVFIEDSNLVGFNELALWSATTNSPIIEVASSTKLTTAGPKY